MRHASALAALALASLAPVAVVSNAVAQTPPAIPACTVTAGTAPYLARYDELSTPGAQYRVRLRYDPRSHSWMPAPALAMPMHHASSLEYVDYTMPPASTATLDATIVAIDRRLVSFEAGVRTWFFAYRVRVTSVCAQAP